MAYPRRRSFPRVLTASAAVYDTKSSYTKRQAQHWQLRALDYYETIGEIRYACQFYARMISRIRIFPAVLEENGNLTPITEGAPVDLLQQIQDPGGGRSQLQGNYGRLMFITGEGVLFGARLGTPEERWNFLWLDEVQENDKGQTFRLDANKQPIEEGVAYRMWRPSPRHSDVADAPMRSVQEICEELILLSKAVQSTALTRLTKGILLMPQEISPGAAEPFGDEDPENNPFMSDLIAHFSGQVENPGSPEARVPPIIEGSYEYIDRIRWMQMHDPQTDYFEKDLREEAITRLALGLDFPPEVLKGMTDANHWTAKQVVHDMWRSHGAPIAEQFCDDISEAYLRPALSKLEYEDWSNVVVAFDDADVVVSPDRTEDANDARDRPGTISAPSYRELKGIPEAMKPDDEETQLQIALHMKNPLLLPERYLPEGGLPAPVGTPGPDPGPEDDPNPEEGPPSPGTRDGSRQESRTASAKIMGAAEMALMECRKVAGSRIRTYKKSCPECLEPANGKPNALVASLIGPEILKQLNAPPPLKLVGGGSENFKSLLSRWGVAEIQATALAEMVEVYAAKTLYDASPGPLPSGFEAHVQRVQEVSNALGG